MKKNSILCYSSIMQRLNFYFAVLLAFLMPLHYRIPEMSILLFFLYLLEGGFREKIYNSIFKKEKFIFFILIGYFVYIGLSILLFEPRTDQFFELERRWSLLIFPLIFLFPNNLFKNKKNIDLFLWAFVAGSIIIALYQIQNNPSISFPNFVVSVHSANRIRFSFIIAFASVISFYFLLYRRYNILLNLLLIYSITIFTLSIYISSSRSGIVALIVIFVVAAFLIIKSKNIHQFIKLLAILILSLFILFITKNPRLQKKLVYSPRHYIYKASFSAIKNNFSNLKTYLTGLGVKNADRTFQNELKTLNKPEFRHPHNDIFSITLKRGFLGLFFIVTILLYPIIKFFRTRNILLLFFFLVFSIHSSFNGIFEQRHDIYIFYYFYSILIFLEFNNKTGTKNEIN